MAGAHIGVAGGNTICMAVKLAGSPRFKTLFRDGMKLVEEVAAYLDGPGRDDARTLPRAVATAYAAESMRLTTRLMQVASWLLVQRAVNEGEMTSGQAEAEKHKVRLCAQEVATGATLFAQLPDQLRDLTERSLRLQARVLYLDRSMRALEDAEPPPVAARELDLQWERIRSAFRARP